MSDETSRQRFGGMEGYTIFRIEKKNGKGVVTSTSYEVVTPEGEFLDRFSNLEQAMRLMKSLAGMPLDADDFPDHY